MVAFIFAFFRALKYHVKKSDYPFRERGQAGRKKQVAEGARQRSREREDREREREKESPDSHPGCSIGHMKETILDLLGLDALPQPTPHRATEAVPTRPA